MELLEGDMPVLQRRTRRVLHWGDAHQLLDFTTKDDVAAVTATAALDPTTPRVLRFAGDSVSARNLATVMTDLTGERWRTFRAGSARSLDLIGAVLKRVAPEPGEVFPAWQGIAYSRDMFSGRRSSSPWTTTATRSWLGPPSVPSSVGQLRSGVTRVTRYTCNEPRGRAMYPSRVNGYLTPRAGSR